MYACKLYAYNDAFIFESLIMRLAILYCVVSEVSRSDLVSVFARMSACRAHYSSLSA